MNNTHADTEILRNGESLEEADKAVIMLHGRGATAHSIIQLHRHLPDASYIAPQAEGREWYPHSFLESRDKNQEYLDSALRKVDSLVEEAAETVGKENLYFLGFSQGGCLASEYVASKPGRYGGVFVLSGGFIGETVEKFSGDLEQTPVFIGCSDNDPFIPLERVEETVEIFEKLDADVEKYIFEGTNHGIVDYEIERISEMLK